MYIAPAYRITDRDYLLSAIAATGVGLLLVNGADGAPPDLSPVPWLLSADGTRLRAHLAKGNPMSRLPEEGVAASVVFMGPDAYVSPNYYPSKAETHKVVPTWNYSVIRVTGRLTAYSDRDRLLSIVEDLTARHEAGQPVPWSTADAPPDYIDSMLKAIVGIDLAIESIEGKYKMSQNRSRADYDGVITGMSARPAPQDQAVAALMATLPNQPGR